MNELFSWIKPPHPTFLDILLIMMATWRHVGKHPFIKEIPPKSQMQLGKDEDKYQTALFCSNALLIAFAINAKAHHLRDTDLAMVDSQVKNFLTAFTEATVKRGKGGIVAVEFPNTVLLLRHAVLNDSLFCTLLKTAISFEISKIGLDFLMFMMNESAMGGQFVLEVFPSTHIFAKERHRYNWLRVKAVAENVPKIVRNAASKSGLMLPPPLPPPVLLPPPPLSEYQLDPKKSEFCKYTEKKNFPPPSRVLRRP